VRVRGPGRASYAKVYDSPVHRLPNGRAKQRFKSLASTTAIRFAEALIKNAELNRVIRIERKDPLDAREAERAESAAEATFGAVGDNWLAANAHRWTNPRSRDAVAAFFRIHCAGILRTPIVNVDTHTVLGVLLPLAKTKPDTMIRGRGWVEAVIGFAIASGRLPADHQNPARWKNHLATMLPTPRQVRAAKHQAAIAYADAPELMRALQARPELAARAFEFDLHTVVRSNDILKMQWAHVDLACRVWTIPKTKNGEEHRVPLSDAAVELLERLPRDGERVFEIGPSAMRRVRDALVVDGAIDAGAMTIHGARAIFKTWAEHETTAKTAVIEPCLSHKIPKQLEKAYRRGDFFMQRGRLMQDWSYFLTRHETGRNVVSLHA
jgi:integrase